MFSLKQDVVKSLGFDLDEAIVVFRAELDAHALSIDVPAPIAHPLVEQIVRYYAGVYTIVVEPTEIEPELAKLPAVSGVDSKLEERLAKLEAQVTTLGAIAAKPLIDTKK